MEGLSIIETTALKDLILRITNMEMMLIELIKYNKEALPGNFISNVPGFITVKEAAKKYHFSKTTIHNRINLFMKIKGRGIDRLQTGNEKRINETELLEAFRLPTEVPDIFRRKM